MWLLENINVTSYEESRLADTRESVLVARIELKDSSN